MLRFLLATLPSLLWATTALAGSGGGSGNPIKTVNSLPEPASLAVLGAGAGAVMLYRRFRK
jgi:hypothetical protein